MWLNIIAAVMTMAVGSTTAMMTAVMMMMAVMTGDG